MIQYTRRGLGRLAGLSGLGGISRPKAQPRNRASSAPRPRVVVVGGGAGGATAAKYLAMAENSIDVTLIEPNPRYTTCFFSNLVLAGMWPFERLNHGYETLAQRYGIRVVHDYATMIDPLAKTVQLRGGERLSYDRLVLAPGIAFREGSIPGYDETAAEMMPHAWMAGAQTVLLRRQLEDMADGGVFVITAPPDPYRCPPAPYERAALVASYFKRQKPRSKILILDEKDTFLEQDLFEDGWRRRYGEMIEWLPAQFTGGIQSIDPARRTVNTSGLTFKADVANVIPAQCAAHIARDAGLADASGWCPVDPATFESTLHPDIHLVGDAVVANRLPKSAYAANSQAKACASAIILALTGREQPRPILYNTCYTLIGPDEALGETRHAHTAPEAYAWYTAFTEDVFK